MKKPIIVLIIISFFSCKKEHSLNEYSSLYKELKNNDTVKMHFFYAKKSSSSARQFTLSNEKQNFLTLENLKNEKILKKDEINFKNKLYSYSDNENLKHGNSLSLSLLYYLKAYKKYVIDQKVSKELFKKVMNDLSYERYQSSLQEILRNKKIKK